MLSAKKVKFAIAANIKIMKAFEIWIQVLMDFKKIKTGSSAKGMNSKNNLNINLTQSKANKHI